MIRTWAAIGCFVVVGGCASMDLGLPERTSRAIGLPAGSEVTISNDSGPGIVGHRYYTASTKSGDAYNCTIFSSMGFEDRPQCIRQTK